MPKLLYVYASPRARVSKSIQMADAFHGDENWRLDTELGL